MKLKVDFNGEIYKGNGFQDLVKKMKLQSYVRESDKSEYMNNVTTRVENFRGAEITYNDCREFIMELIRVGAISEMKVKREDEDLQVYSINGGDKNE